jgi:L-threonylcarbamoyladenylate synthase
VGVESTIIGFEDNRIVLYRAGGVPAEAIEEVLQEKLVLQYHTTSEQPEVPGQLAAHYAPETRLVFGDIDSLITKYTGRKMAIISLQNIYPKVPVKQQYLLSPTGQLTEAAANLFSVLHRIDQEKYDIILAEEFPNEGLGRAINDRLKRAAI